MCLSMYVPSYVIQPDAWIARVPGMSLGWEVPASARKTRWSQLMYRQGNAMDD